MRVVYISIVIFILSVAIIGQTNRGGVSGTVTDTNGAVVPGAKVTLTSVSTKQSVTVTTSSSGTFSISALDPVQYTILVEAPNFKKAVVQNVKVDTATVATVNIAIQPGNVDESVTIQADAQQVNADSGTITQTITERQLRDLPLNNRSVLDLAVTMPNVSGDSGSEDIDAGVITPSPGFNLSVNGGRPGSTLLMADGVNNTGVGIARSVVSFSPETVQEFSIQSSAYSAEFGTTGGGIINITTKSGANNFFGTALLYSRNPVTNARAWNQGTAPRPANNLRSNQASFTVGGPIFLPSVGDGGKWYYDGRKKSFFFFAWEPRWRTDFTQGSALVPGVAERSGNFRDLVLTTNSGWLPKAVATQFNQALVAGADNNIYQQFTLGAGGTLVPINVPSVAGNQFCPFGWVKFINGAQQVSFNGDGTDNGLNQPYCTTGQAQAQITNAANNPLLNIIPSQFMDPTALKLLGFMDPAGGYFLDNGAVRNLFSLRKASQNESRFTVRLDHNITDRAKVTFRWSKTPAVGIRNSNGSDINGNQGIYSDASQYLGTFNYIFSPAMTNEFRLNYTKGTFSEDYSPEFSIMSGRNLSTELGIKSLTTGGMPLITAFGTDGQYAAPDIGSSLSTNNFNNETRWDFSDTLYWTHGNMTWKMGGGFNRARLAVTPFFAAAGGRWNFRRLATNNSPGGVPSNNNLNGVGNGGNTVASFLLGVPLSVDFRPALFNYHYQWDSYAAFVQNDWKIKPNLTLNLGVRYAPQLPRTEDDNLQGVLRPDMAIDVPLSDTQRRGIATAAGVQTTDPIPTYVPTSAKELPFAFSGRGGRSRHLTPIDWGVIEPRFGFAWSPKMKIFGIETDKYTMVLRGGFGISHFPINGNNRGAIPDFGGFTTASTLKPTAVGGAGSNNTAIPGLPLRFSGNNPIQGSTLPLDALLGTDANGLVFAKSIAIPGVAVDINDPHYGTVPYSQSWNIALQFAPFKDSTIEIAYVANRGVHLYTPQININQRDINTIQTLTANNVNPTGNANDPLGRTNLLNGAITTSVAGLFSNYVGFEVLNKYFNANSHSIRHAGYVDFRRRVGKGLSFTANYTFAKSMDDSSDASPDVRVLTSGSVKGQVALGGALQNDYSLSAFDTRHAFASTFTWDLPFGKGRQFFRNAPWYVNGPLGGWVMSGVARLVSGNPYQPFLTDPNLLGGAGFNRVVRPDIVAGVPLKNPLYDPSCRVGPGVGTAGFNVCEPYVNPAAFKRPAKGQLGNAPRTLSITEPMRKYFDLSIQKDFPMPWISAEGRRRINFRVDALNVFNIPNFYFNSRGNTPFGFDGFPVEFNGNECIANLTIRVPDATNCPGGATAQRSSTISGAEYDAWAAFNNQPLSTTPAGAAILGQIRTTVDATRLAPRPGQTSGALPDNFFTSAVPQGFATTNPLAFNITTLQGFQLWRIRNSYEANFGSLTSGQVGNSFGSPNPGTSSRYLQFGIRLIF
ncbi:MAG: TonB-dependent receptor [Acidobacteriota bacterium]